MVGWLTYDIVFMLEIWYGNELMEQRVIEKTDRWKGKWPGTGSSSQLKSWSSQMLR
jgi:hypothetical protein